jgi:hypothetical protein
MAVVYGSLIAPVFLGRLLGSARRSPHLLFGATAASLSASLLFFLATNLAVWTFSGYYPTTPAGLLASFAAALPFFRFTLAGDLVSTAFLFASFLLLTRAFGVRSPASRPALLTPAVA